MEKFDLEQLLETNLKRGNTIIENVIKKYNDNYNTNITFDMYNVLSAKRFDNTFKEIVTFRNETKHTVTVEYNYAFGPSSCLLVEQPFANSAHERIFFEIKCLFGLVMLDENLPDKFADLNKIFEILEYKIKDFYTDEKLFAFAMKVETFFKSDVLQLKNKLINPNINEVVQNRKTTIYQMFNRKDIIDSADLICIYFKSDLTDSAEYYVIVKIRDRQGDQFEIQKGDIITNTIFEEIIRFYKKPIIIDSEYVDFDNEMLIPEDTITKLRNSGKIR